MTTIEAAPHLSNEALIAEIAAAAGRERQATAQLVALLAELDSRRLYLEAGCASLFTYCTDPVAPVGARRLRAYRSGARVPPIPGTPRRVGRRVADADGGHAPGAAPHRRQSSRGAGRGTTFAQAGHRSARRTTAATAGCPDSGSQAAGACGAFAIGHGAHAGTGVPANADGRR